MKISVIGQGYVGLTLAIGAAKVGHNVVGFDVNKDLVRDLKHGKTNIPGLNSLEIQNLVESLLYNPTFDPKKMSDSEVVIIAVPTPLDEDRKPDLNFVESAAKILAENLTTPALIVNESTSFPGTLRNFIKPIIESHSKLQFLYASSPERVDPGNTTWYLHNTPRVISGLTPPATRKAVEFYSTFCQNIVEVSSPEVAEASKVFENTFRQVNIALVNEFSEISYGLGFSANEALMAASTKPFGYMPFFPSVGVGGHCIPIDPTYLSYIAKKNNIPSPLLDLANKINLNMPFIVAERIKKSMGGSIVGKKIQIAGISYKVGVADMRESPAVELMSLLEKMGAKITWSDPLVQEFNGIKSTKLKANIDLGLILTPHREIDFSVWKENNIKVLDLSSVAKNYGWPKFL